MPKRAFLCHSSEDKDYVRRVAAQLGRAKVVFDDITFEAGVDFRDSIRQNLDNTGVFTFIASKKSIDSTWCKFEMDEAELAKIEGGIKSQLTFIIDPQISINDVPVWLRRSKVIFQPKAAQAAREIQQHLLFLLAPEIRLALVGREDDLREFGDNVVPLGRTAPRVLITRGLAGVGRRSFLERAINDNLSLPVGPYFTVDKSTGPDDLFMFLMDEVRDDVTDRNAAAKELDAFSNLTPDEQAEELAQMLIEVCRGRTVPCFVDLNAMLAPDGHYLPVWQAVIETFLKNSSDLYLATVHTRRPTLQEYIEEQFLDSPIGALNDRATVRLVNLMLRRAGVEASDEHIEELAEYVAGYPPAAHFAAAYAKRYGLDLLMADKRDLEDFKARRFQRFLEEGIDLDDDQWMILSYLGGERGVPFQALKLALNMEDVHLAAHLRVLMDLSLIRLADKNYEAAAPVISALYRVKPFPSKDFYAKVAQRLGEAYWADENITPPFSVIDATLHAAMMSGATDFAAASPFIRISTMHRAAQEMYYQEDYPAALAFARRAQGMGATGTDVRSRQVREVAFKSLVRLRMWGDADAELETIEAGGDKRFYFLKGFGLRAQGKLDQALSSYRSALRVGDTRMSVHREIAFCLMNMGEYEEAIKACDRALAKEPSNPFVLDTLVSSYIGMKEYTKVGKALELLDGADVAKRFIHHRRASYYFAIKQYALALEEADAATEGDRGRFEAFGQRVNILIDAGMFEEAREALESLADKYPRSRGDVVIGLRCKSEIRQEHWREAENLWNQLEQQDSPIAQALLKSILQLKSEDRTVSLPTRQEARRRADRITLDLADFDNAMSILTLSDDDISNVLNPDE